MTDRHSNNVLRETLLVVAISAGLAIGLTTIATMNAKSASLSSAVNEAVMSIDPGIAAGMAAPAPAEPGSIVVAGLPPGFFVRLDGLAYPAGADSKLEIETKPGSHRVEICNHQGDSWVTRVSVPRGGRIGLRPALGGEIVFEAADGESVPGDLFLDGRRLGSVPVIIDSASVGVHTAEIRSDMGVLWRSDIMVKNGTVTQVPVPSRFRTTAEN